MFYIIINLILSSLLGILKAVNISLCLSGTVKLYINLKIIV